LDRLPFWTPKNNVILKINLHFPLDLQADFPSGVPVCKIIYSTATQGAAVFGTV
jgi:hypothetical protein